jgi:tetratricopeptide (TPR) repeat protein
VNHLADGTIVARRWRIVRFIAAGGMGDVYEADDLDLGVKVALKAVRADDREMVERFKREVQLARRVTHPNVCRVFDLGFFDGDERLAFLTMEFLHGISLAERIKRGPIPVSEALPVARQMAAGLAAAHAAGVVHRDFKSSNVMLCAGESGMRAVVTDFGLAFGSDAPRLSHGGMVIGTLDYMAPEQLAGDLGAVGPAADQYALAVVLFEMLTGALPFPHGDLKAASERGSQPIPSVRSRMPSVSRSWDQTLRRGMSKEPSARFPDVRALVAALEETAGAARPRLLPALVVGLVLIAAAVGVRVWQKRDHGKLANVHLRPSLAVLGFHANEPKPEDAWLGTAFAELLATEFAAGEQLRVAPGEAVGHAKKELEIPDAGILDKSTLERVRRRLDVDWVVAGRYTVDADRKLTLDVELDDALTGVPAARFTETGSEAELLDLVARASARLRVALGLPTGSERDRLKGAQPASGDAARLYAEGVERFQSWDYKIARDKLLQAIELDPQFALAHSALADTYYSLGYETKAAEEAQKAIDLSMAVGLSQKDKLLSEARLRKAKAEWPRAIEIYRSLFTFYPDEITWGLQLARAQTMGGRSAEALKTVESLRHLPPPLRDDPLIDIREAHAHSKQGDWKGWRASNYRAVKKAEAIGARGIVADANWAIGAASEYLGEYELSRQHYGLAKQIWSELGDRRGVAKCVDGLAHIAQQQGDFETARKQFAESLAFYQEIGDEFSTSDRLNLLGEVEHGLGHVDEAKKWFDESRAHWAAMKELEGIGNVDGNYAELLIDTGDLAEAEQKIRAGLEPLKQVGMWTHVWALTCDLATVKRRQGAMDEAKKLSEQCLAELRKVGDPSYLTIYIADEGRRLREEDQAAAAKKAVDEALALARGHEVTDDVAWFSLAEAELALDAGHAAEALGAVRGLTLPTRARNDLKAAQKQLEARALLATGESAATVAHEAVGLAWGGFMADVRLRASITEARAGDCRAFDKTLRAVDDEAAKKGMVDVGLEARLARGELEGRCGAQAASKKRLAALAEEAQRLGFARIARLARR